MINTIRNIEFHNIIIDSETGPYLSMYMRTQWN